MPCLERCPQSSGVSLLEGFNSIDGLHDRIFWCSPGVLQSKTGHRYSDVATDNHLPTLLSVLHVSHDVLI